jgi:hypothetical protein
MNATPDLSDLGSRLDRIEAHLALCLQMLRGNATQSHYTIDEFAAIVNKAPFTCREWARLGRIRATKRHSGRGRYKEWAVTHEELERYRQHGLLPLNRP